MNFEKLDKVVEKENSNRGGFSVIAKVQFEFGYATLIKGIAPSLENIFLTEGIDTKPEQEVEAIRKLQLQKAKEFIESTGINANTDKPKRPNYSMIFYTPKDTVLTGENKPEHDKFDITITWGTNWEEVVKPSMECLPGLGWHWVRLSYIPDPSGRTYADKTTGEERASRIAIVAEYYETKEAAQAAADVINKAIADKKGTSTTTTAPGKFLVPEGWESGWADTVKQFKLDAAKSSPEQLASMYGLDIIYVDAALNPDTVVSLTVPDLVSKYKITPTFAMEVKKALQ